MTLRPPSSREQSKASLDECTSSLPPCCVQEHEGEAVAIEEKQLRISHILLSSRTHPHPSFPRKLKGRGTSLAQSCQVELPVLGTQHTALEWELGSPEPHSISHSLPNPSRQGTQLSSLSPSKETLVPAQDPMSWGLGSETPFIYAQTFPAVLPKLSIIKNIRSARLLCGLETP